MFYTDVREIGPQSETLSYPLGYWKVGIDALASKKILRLRLAWIKSFAWFYKGYNYKVSERNVAIKRVGILRIDHTLLLCIFYRHLSLGLDTSAM